MTRRCTKEKEVLPSAWWSPTLPSNATVTRGGRRVLDFGDPFLGIGGGGSNDPVYFGRSNFLCNMGGIVGMMVGSMGDIIGDIGGVI